MKLRESTALSFGKFKGKLISELPTSYLKWLVEECSLLAIPRNEAIKIEIEAELEMRVERTMPARIKAYERHEEDRILLSWWLAQEKSWFRIGFPPDLPSETDFWVPPFDMHHSPEWYAFQKRKADFRKRLRHQIAGKKGTCD